MKIDDSRDDLRMTDDKMSRRKYVAVAGAAAAAAAIGGAAYYFGTQKPATTEKIRVFSIDIPEGVYLAAITEDFPQAELVNIPFLESMEKGLTELVSESGYFDVMLWHQLWLPQVGESKLAMDVQEEFDMTSAERNDLEPGILNVCDYETADGTRASMWPVRPCIDVNNYYRTDLFEEHGLTPPNTIDEYIDSATELNDPPNRYGTTSIATKSLDSFLRLAMWMWANDGGYFGDGGWQEGTIINEPESVEALQMRVDFFQKYKVWPDEVLNCESDEWVKMFSTGKLAMAPNWPYQHYTCSDPEKSQIVGKYKAKVMPKWVNHISGVGGWGVIVPKACKHKETVSEYLRFITNYENQKWMGLNIISPTARISVNKDPDIIATAPPDLWEATYFQYENPDVPCPNARVAHPKYNEFVQITTTAGQDALLKQKTPQEACDWAARKIEDLM